MSSIDERVVEMKFNNSEFAAKARGTLDALASLKNSLKMDGAARGIQDVTRATSQLEGTAANIGRSFSAMGAIAFGALASIGARAVQTGEQIVKSLTIGPISSGLSEYETNLNAIQTILSNTKAAGTNLDDVNKALAELNAYSDKTIYNFSEMAKNIGTFTAAGVDLDRSVASIKGIANLAALSGTNSERAAGAMYQLSQAISAGRVSLQDWNSVNTAGMGGTVFQRALAQTAVAMGKINDSAVKLVGPMKNVTVNGKSFRESIDATGGPSWLTSDVLVATLEQFTGDMTDAELAAKGFTKAQIASIQETARTASLAAQDVKTLSQVFDVAKETAGSGWAATWQIVFGDFEEAKSTFTGLSNAINNIIKASAASRNQILGDWKALGGRTVLIDGIKYAFQALLYVVRPIRDAFRLMFPATTGKGLYNLTVRFHDLMKTLGPGAKTIIDLRRTFAGLFAIVRIGWDFFKAGAKFLADLFGVITKGGGGVLEFTGNLGDFIVGVQQAIEKGQLFTKFFDGLVKILRGPIELIKRFVTAVAGIFDGLDARGATGSLDALSATGATFARIGDQATEAWDKFISALDRLWAKLKPFREGVKKFFHDAGSALGDFLNGLSFGDIMAGISTGAFATLVISIRKFLKNFSLKDLFASDTAGNATAFMQNIKDVLEQLSESLQSLQNALNSAALLGIAAAIGILALSVMALAHIPPDDLTRSVIAIGLLTSQLAASAFVFKRLKPSETAKLVLLGIAFVALSIAIRILASAVKTLGDLNWVELSQGLTSLVGILIGMAGLTRIISTQNKNMVRTGAGLILLAVAVKILASAVKNLSDIGWVELSKGLTGVGALLVALSLFSRFTKASKAGVGAGIGIILLATSIKILASAVKDIAKLNWMQILKGLTGVTAGLIAMAGAMKLMPRQGISRGTGLVLAAASLLIVAQSLKQIGVLSWGKIVKGLVVMGAALLAMTLALKYIPTGAVFSALAMLGISAALLVIAIAMKKIGDMDWSGIAKAVVGIGAVALIIGLLTAAAATGIGAAAMIVFALSLIVVAGALYIIAQALTTIGAMSWADIGAAIGGLGLLFVVLAIGGLLSPLIGGLAIALTSLAVAIAIVGGGIAAAGMGIYLFADAMKTLSKIDPEGMQHIVEVLTQLIALLPLIATALADSVNAFVTTLGEHTSEMSTAFSKIVDAFIQVLTDETPRLIAAFGDMIVSCLTELDNRMPDMIQKGSDIVTNLLQGLADNVGRVSQAGANLVIATFKAIGKEVPRMAEAGAIMVINLLNGLADTIRTKGPELRAAGGNLVGAIFDGIFSGVEKNEPSLLDKFKDMGLGALQSAAKALGISSPSKKFMQLGQYAVQGFIKGLVGNKQQVTDAVNSMLSKINDAMYDAQQRQDAAKRSLDRLNSARKKDNAEIQRQQGLYNQATSEIQKASKAHAFLATTLSGHHYQLRRLADLSNAVGNRLAEAGKKLEDAKRTRDDYFNSLHDQYDNLPEITGKTNLTKYMADFQKQITDTQEFATAIQELRKRGLNDTMYKELLAKGPEAMPFVQQILNQGVEGITKLNDLGTALDQAASGLAKTASASLYQAGVDAAQGLVDGLKKQQKQIQAQMTAIAKFMANAIRAELGIRSPSRVMQEIGAQTAAGIAKGLEDSTSVVERSAQKLGGSAIDGMRKTLTGLNDLISGEIDSKPVIAPVLDLNSVRKDASLLNNMLAVDPIDIRSQVQQARDAAAGLKENQTALDQLVTAGAGDMIAFTQNNYSPKALSSAEIYRQTNNQLSRAKGALAT